MENKNKQTSDSCYGFGLCLAFRTWTCDVVTHMHVDMYIVFVLD